MPDIPGGTVNWREDVKWPSAPVGDNHEDSESLLLRAPVWDFTGLAVPGIMLDDGGPGVSAGVKCVVLGLTKAGQGEEGQADCYVLVVTTPDSAGGDGDVQIWERVGVGKIHRKHVAWQTPGSPVAIR